MTELCYTIPLFRDLIINLHKPLQVSIVGLQCNTSQYISGVFVFTYVIIILYDVHYLSLFSVQFSVSWNATLRNWFQNNSEPTFVEQVDLNTCANLNCHYTNIAKK